MFCDSAQVRYFIFTSSNKDKVNTVLAKIIRPPALVKQFAHSQSLTTLIERKVYVTTCIRVCSIQILN
jgi:hypothetical protein